MSKIIIDVNIFDDQGVIFLYNEKIEEKEVFYIEGIHNLPAAAVKYAISENVDYIGISSLSEFAETLQEDILHLLKTEYSNNNIKVEII